MAEGIISGDFDPKLEMRSVAGKFISRLMTQDQKAVQRQYGSPNDSFHGSSSFGQLILGGHKNFSIASIEPLRKMYLRACN